MGSNVSVQLFFPFFSTGRDSFFRVCDDPWSCVDALACPLLRVCLDALASPLLRVCMDALACPLFRVCMDAFVCPVRSVCMDALVCPIDRVVMVSHQFPELPVAVEPCVVPPEQQMMVNTNLMISQKTKNTPILWLINKKIIP